MISLPKFLVHFLNFYSISSTICQECVSCPKVCVISNHALLTVRSLKNCGRYHLAGNMRHPKQQLFSGDDIAGDNSNQEQLGRFWLQKAKQGFARGHPKRKLGANVLVEP